ncbi:MAG: hypothetical protein AB7U24_02485 [Sulfurimonadaceae bacterium]
MKLFLVLILFLTQLSAATLSFALYQDDQTIDKKELQTTFLQNVKHANAIIKRGEYEKLALCLSDHSQIVAQLDRLDISQEERVGLQEEINEYFTLVEEMAQTLRKQAPDLNAHYRFTLEGLRKFNAKIASIGLFELSSKWIELSRIKNGFVKKPNAKLEKEFEDTYNAITVIITELYLDEEIEEPMLAYLKEYKAYFSSIASAYKTIDYKKIAKLKPLGYKIKAKLELYASL